MPNSDAQFNFSNRIGEKSGKAFGILILCDTIAHFDAHLRITEHMGRIGKMSQKIIFQQNSLIDL